MIKQSLPLNHTIKLVIETYNLAKFRIKRLSLNQELTTKLKAYY